MRRQRRCGGLHRRERRYSHSLSNRATPSIYRSRQHSTRTKAPGGGIVIRVGPDRDRTVADQRGNLCRSLYQEGFRFWQSHSVRSSCSFLAFGLGLCFGWEIWVFCLLPTTRENQTDIRSRRPFSAPTQHPPPPPTLNHRSNTTQTPASAHTPFIPLPNDLNLQYDGPPPAAICSSTGITVVCWFVNPGPGDATKITVTFNTRLASLHRLGVSP